jgi:hypothetical protein
MTKTHTYAVAALIAAAFTAQAGSSSISTNTVVSNGLPALEGSVGIDVATGYDTKGIHIDSKASTQPYLNLRVPFTVNVYEIDSASVNFSTRQFSNPNATLNDWYRSEVNAGVTFNSGSFAITPTYHSTTSPNSVKGSDQAVNLTVKYNGLLGLNPQVMVYRGLAGTPGYGTGNGTYYVAGVTPSTSYLGTTLSLPVNVGVGSDNFYPKNQKYGYVSVGLGTKTPVLKNVFLNTSTTYYNAKETLNPTNTNHWVASAGLSLEF